MSNRSNELERYFELGWQRAYDGKPAIVDIEDEACANAYEDGKYAGERASEARNRMSERRMGC